MTPDGGRPARHPDPYGRLDRYTPYHSQERLQDRLTQPSFVVSAFLLIFAFLYQTIRARGTHRRPAIPVSESLWNGLIYLIPASLLFAADRWLNPPLFPVPMLQSQARTHATKSDVLKRLLGLDKPGGIMRSVSHAGRVSLSNLSSVGLYGKGHGDQPAGLGNWDNSCYQNSILQGLAALEPLPRYLAGPGPAVEGGTAKGDTADTLRELIAELTDSTNNGKTLWTPTVLKNMSTWQQQDAQEYFSKLLDEIDKEIAKALRAAQSPPGFETDCMRDDSEVSQHSDDSGYQSLSSNSKLLSEVTFMGNPLEGLVAQRVACVSCGHSEGLSMIPFNCITLSLDINSSQYDLRERLDSFTRVESIQGVECPKCTLLKFQRLIRIILDRGRAAGTKDDDLVVPLTRLHAVEAALEDGDFDDKTLSGVCKIPSSQRVSSTKTKQAVIARPPRSLVVHVNRSVFDEITGRSFKNLAAVRFPMALDLGPWCLGSAGESNFESASDSCQSTEKDSLDCSHDEEKWLLDPTSSMVAGNLYPSKITGPIYELRAVVTHYGRHENGHYVCYRKHPRQPRTPVSDEAEHAKADGGPSLLAAHGHSDQDDPDTSSLDWKPSDTGRDSYRSEPVDEADADWWRLSDQDVTRSSREEVLSQGGVFMLFYDCIDSHAAWNPDSQEFVDAQEPGMHDLADEPAKEDEEDEKEDGSVAPEEEPRPKGPSVPEDSDVLSRAVAVPLPDEDSGTELEP